MVLALVVALAVWRPAAERRLKQKNAEEFVNARSSLEAHVGDLCVSHIVSNAYAGTRLAVLLSVRSEKGRS